MKYLKNTVQTIFVVLGKGCNFNCRYCMQNETQKSGIVYPTEINEDIYEFIKEIGENQDKPLYVHFYGGEPLLYKDKLKTITKRLYGSKNILFSVITNGSLIDEEMVQFFNDYNFAVNISWDGKFSSKTRKRNVFEENKENLLKINSLGIAAVISAATPLDELLDSMQELANEYRDKTGHTPRVILDEIFDMDIVDRSLLDVDYEKYSTISRNIAKECLDIKTNKIKLTREEFEQKYWAKMSFFDKVYGNIQRYAMRPDNCVYYMVHCCNGVEVLSLDLEGNLYSCHNCDIKIGTIYSDFVCYLDNLVKNDNTRYFYEKYCKDCPVYPACRGGCKLILEKARNETYCNMKKAIFTPILEEILASAQS